MPLVKIFISLFKASKYCALKLDESENVTPHSPQSPHHLLAHDLALKDNPLPSDDGFHHWPISGHSTVCLQKYVLPEG